MQTMKLALFSYEVTKKASDKLSEWVGKKPKDIKLVYITTAANVYPPNPDWLLHTKKQLKSSGYQIEGFDLEQAFKDRTDLKTYFSDKDVVFISGGNTFYLIYWVLKTGFDKLLKDLLDKGKVYAGSSAGAVCLVDNLVPMGKIDEPEKAPEKVTKGLALIDFAPIPHWGEDKYQERLNEIKKDYERGGVETKTITNEQALFVNNKKKELVE
jgi:dipeptidase E